jgi:hypothetical protein
MKERTNEPERATSETEKKEERRREEARAAEGTWANLVRIRKNAKGG